MMKEYQDIANLISIRNFLVLSIDNLHIKLSRDEVKNIQTRIQYLDKTIVEYSLKLDLSKIGRESHNVVREFSVESSEDTKDVMSKFATASVNPEIVKKSQKLENIVRNEDSEK